MQSDQMAEQLALSDEKTRREEISRERIRSLERCCDGGFMAANSRKRVCVSIICAWVPLPILAFLTVTYASIEIANMQPWVAATLSLMLTAIFAALGQVYVLKTVTGLSAVGTFILLASMGENIAIPFFGMIPAPELLKSSPLAWVAGALLVLVSIFCPLRKTLDDGLTTLFESASHWRCSKSAAKEDHEGVRRSIRAGPKTNFEDCDKNVFESRRRRIEAHTDHKRATIPVWLKTDPIPEDLAREYSDC